MNINSSLIIRSGRVCLRLANRNGRVAFDHLRHHTAERFNTQRKRGDIEQEDVLDIAAEHTTLDRRTDRDDFIRIDTLVWLFAIGQLADHILDHRHTC